MIAEQQFEIIKLYVAANGLDVCSIRPKALAQMMGLQEQASKLLCKFWPNIRGRLLKGIAADGKISFCKKVRDKARERWPEAHVQVFENHIRIYFEVIPDGIE